MMSGIRGTDTKPELVVRKLLHRRGYRYRLHDRRLPGRPDIVLPKYRAVIEVNGCFWHGHNCHLFKWPQSRKKFWKDKILGNKARDERNIRVLMENGWRVLVVWECALKGAGSLSLDELRSELENFLKSQITYREISGHPVKQICTTGT